MYTNKDLFEIANKNIKYSYSPYSRFRVSAVLLTKEGEVFTGVNIENISNGATICAERTALVKAISEGKTKISKILITSDSEEIVYPCGICRQFMLEFFDKETIIICCSNKGEFREYTIDQLLPYGFKSF